MTSSPLTKFMLGFMVLFLGTAAYDVFLGTRGTDRLIGLLGAAATCLLVSVVFLETAWFEFARSTQTIAWRRRWGLRRRSGSLRFGEVQSVQVERPLGDDGTPSPRIILKTTGGAVIPLTVGYQPDPDGGVVQTADRIRALLGLNSDATPAEEVSALIAAGKKIEAIRVVREREGLSLTAAKQRVNELTRKASSR